MAKPELHMCSMCNKMEPGFYYHAKWHDYDLTTSTGISLDFLTVNMDGTVWYPEWYFNLLDEDEWKQVIEKINSEVQEIEKDEIPILNVAIEAAEATIRHMNIRFMCLKCTNTESYIAYVNFIIETNNKSLEKRAQDCATKNLMGNNCKCHKKRLIRDFEYEIKPYYFCVTCNREIAGAQDCAAKKRMETYERKNEEKRFIRDDENKGKNFCFCMICKHKISASRFAKHLSVCMNPRDSRRCKERK